MALASHCRFLLALLTVTSVTLSQSWDIDPDNYRPTSRPDSQRPSDQRPGGGQDNRPNVGPPNVGRPNVGRPSLGRRDVGRPYDEEDDDRPSDASAYPPSGNHPLGDLLAGVPGRDLDVPLKPLCAPGGRVPEGLLRCGGCEDRCGTVMDPYNQRHGGQCSCDVSCGYHGDCCQDVRAFCPEVYEEFQQVAARYPFTRPTTTSDSGHVGFQCFDFGWSSSLVVDTCPDGSGCKFSEELSEDVNSFVPMYDVNRGIHFINGHCALCNGASQVIPWGVQATCSKSPVDPGQEYQEMLDTGMVNSEESFSSLRQNTRSCSLEYTVVGQARPCHQSYTSTCKSGCGNTHLVDACESGPVEYTMLNGDQYKNLYCALCNAGKYDFSTHLACGEVVFRSGPDVTRDDTIDSFSLTMVFDFDPRKGLSVGGADCKEEEVFVTEENVCREVRCPSGTVQDGLDCIPDSTNLTAIISGTFSTKPSKLVLEHLEQDKSSLRDFIERDVVETFYSFNINTRNLDIQTNLEVESEQLSVSSHISCNCDYKSLFTEENNDNLTRFTEFEDSMARRIRKGVLMYLVRENINLESVRAYVESSMNWTSPLVSENRDCRWLVYEKNETKFDDGTKNQDGTNSDESDSGTLTVLISGKTYPSGMFEVLDEVVIVCESFPDEGSRAVDRALSILTLVCISISIACLAVRILLQFFLTSFSSNPGWVQFHMVLALLLAFCMLIVGPFLVDIPAACTAGAVLMAYGFLAAFTWMNIIAVDTWLVFRPSSAFSRSDDESSLWVHYVLGWGIPAVLVSVSMVMNYVDVDPDYRPEFGGSRCWYTQRYAMLIYFGVPIAVSIILNIVLYIHTSINLHKAFKNALTAIKAEQYHFRVYVKLFVLMGITWVFGFISAFTTQLVLDFLFVILTSLQGLFLFVSFVCNKRVAMEIGKCFRRETSGVISVSRGTTKSTPVPSYDSHDKHASRV